MIIPGSQNEILEHNMQTSIKDIAVYVDPNPDQSSTFTAVAQLATEHNATVTGIYAIPPVSLAFAGTSEGVIPPAVLAQHEESARRHADKIKGEFKRAMKDAAVPYTWRLENDIAEAVVPEAFRYADIGVVTQPKPEQQYSQRGTINHILLNSGRPVLVIPYIGAQHSLGNKVIVGWDGGTECTRAVHDAMPLLAKAEWVEVISVEKDDDEKTLGSSVPISEHLARHGVSVTSTSHPNTELEPGEVLLNRVSDLDADLIVAGAWGHSRAREYIFGGTTRTLLGNMTVPVLLSH